MATQCQVGGLLDTNGVNEALECQPFCGGGACTELGPFIAYFQGLMASSMAPKEPPPPPPPPLSTTPVLKRLPFNAFMQGGTCTTWSIQRRDEDFKVYVDQRLPNAQATGFSFGCYLLISDMKLWYSVCIRFCRSWDARRMFGSCLFMQSRDRWPMAPHT